MSKTNMNADVEIGQGGSLLFVVTIVFFVLKVTNTVDWSWWWVFAPLWIPVAIGVGLLAITALVGIVLWVISTRSRRR